MEIDCITEKPEGMQLVEIKLSETLTREHIKNIIGGFKSQMQLLVKQ